MTGRLICDECGEEPYRPEGWESNIDLAAEAEENFLYLYNKK